MESIPIIAAASAGDRQAIELLLGSVDVNQQDAHGWTALCWAAGRGDTDLIELLLTHGADPVRTGHDQRTPRMIALAAGHLAASALLAGAEPAGREPARAYCKAYLEADLARFPGWPAVEGEDRSATVLFLHEDLTVTRSIHRGRDVVFERPSPEWSTFCSETLGFQPPTDIELARGWSDGK